MRKGLWNVLTTQLTTHQSSRSLTYMQKRYKSYYHYTSEANMKSIQESGKLRASSGGNSGPGVYFTNKAPYFSDAEIGTVLRHERLHPDNFSHYVEVDTEKLKQPFKEITKNGTLVVPGDVDLAASGAKFGTR